MVKEQKCLIMRIACFKECNGLIQALIAGDAGLGPHLKVLKKQLIAAVTVISTLICKKSSMKGDKLNIGIFLMLVQSSLITTV